MAVAGGMNGTLVERFAKREHQKNSDGYMTFPSSYETVNKGKHVTGLLLCSFVLILVSLICFCHHIIVFFYF